MTLISLDCKREKGDTTAKAYYVPPAGCTNHILPAFEKGYPPKTTYCCWWDGYTFDEAPIGIPQSVSSDNTFHCFGIFCSANCASAFALHDLEPTGTYDPILFKYMLNVLYDITIDIIPAAPRWVLQQYGGPVTINEFRSENTVLSLRDRLQVAPLLSVEITLSPNYKGPTYGRVLRPRAAHAINTAVDKEPALVPVASTKRHKRKGEEEQISARKHAKETTQILYTVRDMLTLHVELPSNNKI